MLPISPFALSFSSQPPDCLFHFTPQPSITISGVSDGELRTFILNSYAVLMTRGHSWDLRIRLRQKPAPLFGKIYTDGVAECGR